MHCIIFCYSHFDQYLQIHFLLLLEYIYTNTILSDVPLKAAFELQEVPEIHCLKNSKACDVPWFNVI